MYAIHHGLVIEVDPVSIELSVQLNLCTLEASPVKNSGQVSERTAYKWHEYVSSLDYTDITYLFIDEYYGCN